MTETAIGKTGAPDRRWLFTVAILTGSFLLFLVQPMVARMALPRLGGAPNVWNSAMLVYQALLLAGYAYAHAISSLPIARQVAIHIALLLLAALTLPIALADIAPPRPGTEVLWVPWLFLLTVGLPFFAVSAQAPLMQRWYAVHPQAGNPYPLYAASNLGSFAGLLAYPLVLEPLLGTGTQSGLWTVGYVLLIALVIAVGLSRATFGGSMRSGDAIEEQPRKAIGWRRIALWLALSAVPSGLMLSTTTFLTTDIMAMPLLWVIPLGLYLLSFSIAFSEKQRIAALIVLIAPIVVLVVGAVAMFAAGRAGFVAAPASVFLLFVIAVALHTRLYATRPAAQDLTRFYLVMSAGGALGGVFAALVAPLVFDWTWEHPLLILAAAALVPLDYWSSILARLTGNQRRARIALYIALFLVFMGALLLYKLALSAGWEGVAQLVSLLVVLLLAVLLAARRWSFVAAQLAILLALGGVAQLNVTINGDRERSYFGIYSAQENEEGNMKLSHGTTLHGIQLTAEGKELEPTSYYGREAGIGRAMQALPSLYGENARVGIVGLGVGTLACYRQPGQEWTFFEIDPIVHDYSLRGVFTFLDRCAPDAPVVIGDARLEIEEMAPASFDLLAIDAFTSDAIPQHLLTSEALAIYFRALEDDGLVMFHISNRFVQLRPVLARLVERGGYSAAARYHIPDEDANDATTPSVWVAVSRDPTKIDALASAGGWEDLGEAKGRVWTDDYASILPHLRWGSFL